MCVCRSCSLIVVINWFCDLREQLLLYYRLVYMLLDISENYMTMFSKTTIFWEVHKHYAVRVHNAFLQLVWSQYDQFFCVKQFTAHMRHIHWIRIENIVDTKVKIISVKTNNDELKLEKSTCGESANFVGNHFNKKESSYTPHAVYTSKTKSKLNADPHHTAPPIFRISNFPSK